MNRFWELIVTSRGIARFYCFPFVFILWLVTPFYQFFSRRNLRRRKRECSGDWHAKVISIGNITVGGSGKTPIVGFLVEQLVQQGKRAAIVHSGYSRANREDVLIDYGQGGGFSIQQVGDEVAMLARMVPRAAFAVGRDKKKMVALADQNLNPDVILIDDGYQRLDIKKDVDIVVIDPMLLSEGSAGRFRNDLFLFPRGILREDVESLGRADVIFITRPAGDIRQTPDMARLRLCHEHAPVVEWEFSLSGVEYEGKTGDLSILRNKRPFLFAGIGSYGRLADMIAEAGVSLRGDCNLGDHCDYDASAIDMLRRKSSAAGADCYLTTAKDLVKLAPSGMDKPLFVLQLAVHPDDSGRVNEIIGLDVS